MIYKRELTAYFRLFISECDGRCDLVKWDGDYEGGTSKPDNPTGFNKWCFRACPREKHYEKEPVK